MYVDNIRRVTVSGTGVPDDDYNVVEVLMTDAELAAFRGSYNPDSPSSPPAGTCRLFARCILDATASDKAPSATRAVGVP